jgi:hypothetical protein
MMVRTWKQGTLGLREIMGFLQLVCDGLPKDAGNEKGGDEKAEKKFIKE